MPLAGKITLGVMLVAAIASIVIIIHYVGNFINGTSETADSNSSKVVSTKTLVDPYTINSSKYVSDIFDYITEAEEDTINKIAARLNHEVNLQYAVAIIDSLDLSNTIETFANDLYNKWGLGNNDRGLLLVICMANNQWRFETGYGIEGELPDALLNYLGRNSINPKFAEGKFGEGIRDVTNNVFDYLTKHELADETIYETGDDEFFESVITFVIFFVYILFACIMVYNGFLNFERTPHNEHFELQWEDEIIDEKYAQINRLGECEMPNIWGGARWIRLIFMNLSSIILTVYVCLNPYLWNIIYATIAYMTFICLVYNIRILHMANVVYKGSKSINSENKLFIYYRNVKQNLNIGFKIFAFWIQIPFYFFYRNRYYKYGDFSYICPICKKTAQGALKEEYRKEYLTPRQKFEIDINSCNYDTIYLCESQQHYYAIQSKGVCHSFYSLCPNCGAYAMKYPDFIRTIESPTYRHCGYDEYKFHCEYCNYTENKKVEVPKKLITKLIGKILLFVLIAIISSSGKSSSGRGSYSHSSSGSRGGSRGGGHSGGGGTSGHW